MTVNWSGLFNKVAPSLAGGAVNYWAGNRAADQRNQAAGNVWNQASYQPYNVSTPIGTSLFSGRNAVSSLNPQYSGIADRYRQLGAGFMSGINDGNLNGLRDNKLGLLRQLAQPEEERQMSGMQSMLFNKGLLGSTTGSLQMRGLAEAQSDADLKRQLTALELADRERGTLFDLGTRAFNQDLAMQSIPAQQLALGGQLGSAASGANLAAGQGMYDAALAEADGSAMFWQNLVGSGMEAWENFNTASTASEVGSQLFNAGGGNPFSAMGQIGKESLNGGGGWGDLFSGPRTAAKMPTGPTNGSAQTFGTPDGTMTNPFASYGQWGTAAELASGTAALLGAETGLFASGAGSQAAMLAAQNLGLQGGTALTAEALAANVAAQGGTAAAGAAAGGAGGAGTGALAGAGWLAAPAIMVAGLKWLDSVNWGKGGASESAKLPKMQKELTRRMQADPSGNSAKQFVDSIITNKQWPGELNQDELGTLFKSGMVSLDTFPTLHSSESIVDLWNYDLTSKVTNPNDDPDASHSILNDMRHLRNPQVRSQAIGPQAIAATYGLTKDQQQQYENLLQSARAAKEHEESYGNEYSGVSGRNRQSYQAAKSALDQFKSTYLTEPRKRATATALYNNYRSTGYQGDLTKLERYLGIR